MSQVNAHKPGYKHTPLGWIPEEWEIRELNAIVKAPIVYGIVQAGPETKDGLPYIKSSDVGGEIITQQLSKTSFEIASKYRRSEVVPGDIVFSLRGNIGELSVVPSTLLKANLTQGTARISISDQHDFAFIRYALKSPITSKNIAIKAKGSTFKEISLEQLRTLSIAIPSKEEQQKIATILNTWDEAIIQTQQLIAKLQERNKGLMQELLTGKKRLGILKSIEWKKISLKTIFERVQRKLEAENSTLDVLTISGRHGFLSQNEKFSRVIAGNSLKNYTLLEKGEFAYNKGNSNMYQYGCIFRLDTHQKALVPNVYISFKAISKKIDTTFYSYYFKHDLLKPSLAKIISSGARMDGLLNVNAEDFLGIKVPLPSLDEQLLISKILSDAEHELALAKQMLIKLNYQKKGLMQKLLTGEVRVNYN